MGELARNETASAFRDLVTKAPSENQTRIWQLFESLVFTAAPVLAGVNWLGVKQGPGIPTATTFGGDGFGLYRDSDTGIGYLVWVLSGEMMKWASV